MPRVVDPDVEVPPSIHDGVAIYGSALRMAILRVLAHTPLSTVQLVDELDLTSRGTLPRNLAALEAAGVIIGLPPHGERRGRTVRWHLDAGRVRELTLAMERYALGE